MALLIIIGYKELFIKLGIRIIIEYFNLFYKLIENSIKLI